MAKRGKAAYLGNLPTYPAGMESDSNSEDEDFLFDDTSKRFVPCDPVDKTHRNHEQNGASNSSYSQVINGDHQERTLFKNDQDSGGGNPSHWRKHRMHRSLPVPLDDFRHAVMQGNLDLVKSLVEQGISADSILHVGWTGLMYSCSCAHPEITRYLLEKNADANYHKERYNSLMAACASPREESLLLQCVQHLVEFGCDINTMESHHVTPLIFAARGGRSKIVAFLVEKKADVNLCDNRGWTALAFAISNGHGAVVRILLEANASMDNITSSGKTLVEHAQDSGHDSIAQLLQTFGASQIFPNIELSNQPVSRQAEAEPFRDKKRVKVAPVGDLEFFLTGLALCHLIPVFHLHGISFEQLLRLTDEDLIKIGIDKLGERKKIVEATRDVHRVEWQQSSLASLENIDIGCPDAVAMVANISKHLRYIQSTIGYLRDQIQAAPRILELGKEVNSVRTLRLELEGALKNNINVGDELRFFTLHIDGVQNNVEYVPADMIVERRSSDSDVVVRRQRRRSVWQFSAIAIIVGVAMVTTGAWKKPSIYSGRIISWLL